MPAREYHVSFSPPITNGSEWEHKIRRVLESEGVRISPVWTTEAVSIYLAHPSGIVFFGSDSRPEKAVAIALGRMRFWEATGIRIE